MELTTVRLKMGKAPFCLIFHSLSLQRQSWKRSERGSKSNVSQNLYLTLRSPKTFWEIVEPSLNDRIEILARKALRLPRSSVPFPNGFSVSLPSIIKVQTGRHGKTLKNDIQNTKIDETKSRRRLSQSITECLGDVLEQTMASDNMIVDRSTLTIPVPPLRTSSGNVNPKESLRSANSTVEISDVWQMCWIRLWHQTGWRWVVQGYHCRFQDQIMKNIEIAGWHGKTLENDIQNTKIDDSINEK